jgi:hypothetical protein
MKTKLNTRFIKMIAIFAFLALFAGNAFAIENSSRVISPYWQSDSGDESYTFIAISHTSLSGMASQIGIKLTALQSDGATFAGSTPEFTISAGTTQRIFIVRTNETSINPTNQSDAVFISGTTNFKHGQLLFEPIANSVPGITTSGDGDGYRDVTMLSYWGAVVIQQNTTGFAMEFIGDLTDSSVTNCLASGNVCATSGVGLN